MLDLALIAAVILMYSLVSRRIESTPITAPMVFVTAGMILGPGGIGIIQRTIQSEVFQVVGEIALVFLLFCDAVRINLRLLHGEVGLTTRLLGIGMPLTIGLGTLAAVLLFPTITIWEAAIIGTLLAPTDAALGEAVVSNPRIPAPIRQSLSMEAGLNDGLSVPFLTVFLILAKAEQHIQPGSHFLRVAMEQIGLGALAGMAVGLAGGWLVRGASRRGWMEGIYRQIGLLAIVLITWATAHMIGGNGFIAAYVGGLAVGLTAREIGEQVMKFAEEEGQLLNLVVFFLLGVVALPFVERITWPVALFAVSSLTVVRMLPVAVALVGARLNRASTAFMGWFGPRGLATIVLTAMAAKDAPSLSGRAVIGSAVLTTVLFSVYAHGLTAMPLSSLYERKLADLGPDAPERQGAG
jgi:sodium/hydrogen antiporter